jgi:hypothetical protein
METSRSRGAGGNNPTVAPLASLGASTSGLNLSFSRGLGASSSAHAPPVAHFKRQASSYTFHDHAASVEGHLSLLIEDLYVRVCVCVCIYVCVLAADSIHIYVPNSD